jgi:hypothetical protein
MKCQIIDNLGNTMIWTPDRRQDCAFIPIEQDPWSGTYADGIFLNTTKQFALTFPREKHITIKNCNNSLIESDQGFAIRSEDFNMANNNYASPHRRKRTVNIDQHTPDKVGIVYANQLAAELTAVAKVIEENILNIFKIAVQDICNNMDTILHIMLSQASANPTLLARILLNQTYIKARLISDATLEIKQCIGIPLTDMHFNPVHDKCFDALPVIFMMNGVKHHGFLDVQTYQLINTANQIECDNTNRFLYIPKGNNLMQLDQITGNHKYIPIGEVK